MNKFIVDYSKKSEILPKIGLGNKNSLHIVVVFGGMSAEREPSLLSYKHLSSEIKDLDYQITPVDVGSDIAEVIRSLNPNVVFNCLHGTFGEDGCIQGVLEILGIPYTHSRVLASALALDKIYSQQIFMANGIRCPGRTIINKGDDLSVEPIKRPYVIKPADQGSSLGVEVIFEGDDFNLNEYQFNFGEKAVIEEYITGREIQVAVMAGKAVGTLEVELLQGKRFNDYDCKYRPGFSSHIVPANISSAASNKIMKIAEETHKIMGCKGITRAEFIYNTEKDLAYFLEINTHPGLTATSFVPDILKHNGISMKELFKILIEEALIDANKS